MMQQPAQTKNGPIPMTVIGGFLGSGKTTLLNRVLSEATGVRYGVMVNDFGELSVDDRLITGQDGETMTFANGCVCCTLGDSFLSSLDLMLERDNPPDQIIIEASGVADPRAIADMAVLHPGLQKDLTLVLADASTIKGRSTDERLSDTVRLQLHAANLIILNKCDLVEEAEQETLENWLASESGVPVIKSTQGDIPLDLLRQDQRLIGEDTENHDAHHPHDHPHDHNHAGLFQAFTLTLKGSQSRLQMRAFLNALPSSVLRVKGFYIEEGAPTLVQWAGGQANFSTLAELPGAIGLVVIGTHDMPSRADLEQRLADAGTVI